MTLISMTSRLALAAALAGLCLTSSAGAQSLSRLLLPAAVTFPEGVAYDAASNSLYAGSAVDGGLYRLDATTGAARLVTPPGKIAPADGRFPAMLGMKLDPSGRLWIVGGFTGLVTVVDPRNGHIVKQTKVPTTPVSLLNDLQIVDGFAYVTDTFTPTLWRVAASGEKLGEIEPWLDLRGSPIAFADGPNLNGIAATADGKALIVVQMNKGLLFKIDLTTKAVTPIDVGGADLTGSDGLVLDGATLYVVRQWAGEIVTVSLDESLTRGTVVSRFKDPGLTYPATAAIVGNDLVLANAQFDKHDAGGAQLPFSLVRVSRARLAAKR